MTTASEHRGFWDQLPRPFYILAPMADVTDNAFRQLIAQCGKPDVFFTEFVSCDGLCSRGRDRLLHHLSFTEDQRPIVAQIWGTNPETYYRTAQLLAELGFDGIDINMGCPVKNVCKTGGGSALIEHPSLARELIDAARQGGSGLPVSVKTRIGYTSIDLLRWVEDLLEAEPAAITLHMRTRSEMSKVPAHWELMPEAVKAAAGSRTLIVGNGDIRDLDHADQLVSQTGMDGAMLGRAIFGHPWLFSRRSSDTVTLHERFDTMLQHAAYFEQEYSGKKPFLLMRKHLMAHISGIAGSKDLRLRLGEVSTAADIRAALDWYTETYGLDSSSSRVAG